MIQIKSQDGKHQYDESNNAITTWHEKKCAWIVNGEFEKAKIDWYGTDSDFPAGYTMAEYIAQHPDWEKKPDIRVYFTWNTKEQMQKTCGRPSNLSELAWYNRTSFPHTAERFWGDIDEPKETTVEQFGKYCDFHKNADNVRVTYNGEIIFDGKLK